MTSASVDQSRSWAVSIEAELEAHARDRRYVPSHAHVRYERSASVFRVPSLIKALNPQMYQHQVLSLGLYDIDFVNMAPIDKVRLEVVSEFLEQIKEMPNSTIHSWDALCECVAGPGGDAWNLRHFYPDEIPINLDHTTVRSVLTFDAVFLTVFSFLWSGNWGEISSSNSARFVDAFVQNGLPGNLEREFYFDMMLFENQIPLALVRRVWNLVSGVKSGVDQDIGFNSHIRRFIFLAMRAYLVVRADFLFDDHHFSFVECNHLLHCLYIAVCNPNTPGPASDSERMTTSSIYGTVVSRITHMCAAVAHWTGRERCVGRSRKSTNVSGGIWGGWGRSFPTATELHKAGVKFRGSGKETSLSEIRLEKSTLWATLYLPQIGIEDKTEKVLRNLVLFEMMHSGNDSKLVSYLTVMDDLIDTADDVRLLRKGNNPVISRNNLGSENDIAELFNGLCQNLASYGVSAEYKRLSEEANDWCTQKTRQNVMRFVDRFVDRPWIFVSLIAAMLLLVMTALQTVYTVKGFYQQT